jgi:hypothetical protein
LKISLGDKPFVSLTKIAKNRTEAKQSIENMKQTPATPNDFVNIGIINPIIAIKNH